MPLICHRCDGWRPTYARLLTYYQSARSKEKGKPMDGHSFCRLLKEDDDLVYRTRYDIEHPDLRGRDIPNVRVKPDGTTEVRALSTRNISHRNCLDKHFGLHFYSKGNVVRFVEYEQGEVAGGYCAYGEKIGEYTIAKDVTHLVISPEGRPASGFNRLRTSTASAASAAKATATCLAQIDQADFEARLAQLTRLVANLPDKIELALEGGRKIWLGPFNYANYNNEVVPRAMIWRNHPNYGGELLSYFLDESLAGVRLNRYRFIKELTTPETLTKLEDEALLNLLGK